MTLLDDFKSLFRRPSPKEVASKELAEAELSLLKSKTAKEYSTAMEDFDQRRIVRLRNDLKRMLEQEAPTTTAANLEAK